MHWCWNVKLATVRRYRDVYKRQDAGQVIGYSHSTRLSAEELLAGHPKDDSQVAGYSRAISTACVVRFA